jgi:protein-disulfide isomerase
MLHRLCRSAILTADVLLSLSCAGGGAAPAAEPPAAAAIASVSPPASTASAPSPFAPGLTPCPKDAPAGASCAAPPKPGASTTATAAAEDDHAVWNVPVTADDPVRGPADAIVTVVVFSDFECPFCKHEAETLARLRTDYATDVRVVWKDCPLPMHEHAMDAAELARAARAHAGDDGFWQAHDLLYAAQPDLGESSLHKIASALGLSWRSTRAEMKAARYGVVIQNGLALSDRVDIEATPTVFVNGKKSVGARPYETLRALVDSERESALRIVGTGIARSNVYSHIVANGKEVPPATDGKAP